MTEKKEAILITAFVALIGRALLIGSGFVRFCIIAYLIFVGYAIYRGIHPKVQEVPLGVLVYYVNKYDLNNDTSYKTSHVKHVVGAIKAYSILHPFEVGDVIGCEVCEEPYVIEGEEKNILRHEITLTRNGIRSGLQSIYKDDDENEICNALAKLFGVRHFGRFHYIKIVE